MDEMKQSFLFEITATHETDTAEAMIVVFFEQVGKY